MADSILTDLQSVTATTSTDVLYIVSTANTLSGESGKITIANLFKNVPSLITATAGISASVLYVDTLSPTNLRVTDGSFSHNLSVYNDFAVFGKTSLGLLTATNIFIPSLSTTLVSIVSTTTVGGAPSATGGISRVFAINSNTGSVSANNRGQGSVDLQQVRFSNFQTTSGSYATITGGLYNTSSGTASFIGGGESNNSLGNYSIIVGGLSGAALNNSSIVVGGLSNVVSGNYSTITGGTNNTILSANGFIGGGTYNTVSDASSVVVGGNFNTSLSANNFIGGGAGNRTLNTYSSIVGGLSGVASGQYSFVGGGNINSALSTYSVVVGGLSSIASGVNTFIGGGITNRAAGLNSIVVGGTTNTSLSANSVIVGGSNNSALGDSSVVTGGGFNTSSGDRSATVGGNNNIASGINTFIGGGASNAALSAYSSVIGGLSGYATRYGQEAYSAGSFTIPGDAQRGNVILRNQTINSTQTELFLDGNSVRFALRDNETLGFEAQIIGRRTDSAIENAFYIAKGLVKRDTGVATVSAIGSILMDVITRPNTNWVADVDADVITGSLRFRVTGETSKTIRWVANVRFTEVM